MSILSGKQNFLEGLLGIKTKFKNELCHILPVTMALGKFIQRKHLPPHIFLWIRHI